MRGYLLTALALSALAAVFWSLGPHSSQPFGPWLGRFVLTIGGPISFWVHSGCPILDLSSLVFLGTTTLILIGVRFSHRAPGRILGAVGLCLWFIVGLGIAGSTVP
jgi:hypothetical protein